MDIAQVHQQLSLMSQQQAQAQRAQQVYSVPTAGRPWGWWHQPGSSNILLRLDAVRPPLLQLHTALGGTNSSASLLR